VKLIIGFIRSLSIKRRDMNAHVVMLAGLRKALFSVERLEAARQQMQQDEYDRSIYFAACNAYAHQKNATK